MYRPTGARGARPCGREWQARLDGLGRRPGRAGTPRWRGHGLPGLGGDAPDLQAGRRAWPPARPSRPASTPPPTGSPAWCPGGADLTGNTGMALAGATAQSAEHPGGRLLHYGVREHAMGAVMTAWPATAGSCPSGGTFFVFSDYMRGAVRLAALSEAHVIYSWTHDSVGPGPGRPDPPARSSSWPPCGPCPACG